MNHIIENGICTRCGCSEASIAKFGWSCRERQTPPPLPRETESVVHRSGQRHARRQPRLANGCGVVVGYFIIGLMAGLAWLYASHYPEPINIIVAIATTLSFACGFVMIALEQRFPKESVPVPQRWADTTRAFATLLGCIVGLIVGLQQATVGRDEAAVAGAPESGGHGFRGCAATRVRWCLTRTRPTTWCRSRWSAP